MSKRPYVMHCRGYSPRTGQPVGERHRWNGGGWGKGTCDFCGKYLDEVLEKPKKPEVPAGSSAHLERALEGD
jgi:hypothetical protein